MFKRFRNRQQEINPGQVIIPVDHPNPPEPHEVSAARLLAQHYRCTVAFLTPIDDYLRKTADILMLGTLWEMKSPIGSSKTTISNQFKVASRQARNIIIDSRRTPLSDDYIEKDILNELKRRTRTKKVILINKSELIIEIRK